MSVTPRASKSGRRNQKTRPVRPDPEAVVVKAIVMSTMAGLATVIVLAGLATISSIGATATVGISAVGGIVTASISAIAVYLRRRR
jgi:hypothetical protein